jgi:ATPase subunit of ABC transporter with duplicated ATPase domains
MSLLILEDVKKHFGAQEVLRGASLTVDPGSKVGIVGRNGGGKTTLFHMVTGEEHPDWGKVTLRKGSSTSRPRPAWRAGGASISTHIDRGSGHAYPVAVGAASP